MSPSARRAFLEAHGDPEPWAPIVAEADRDAATARLLATLTDSQLEAVLEDPATPLFARVLATQERQGRTR